VTRENPLERAERITRELRAATAEAAGVLKDLQHTIASARGKIDEYAATELQKVCDAHFDRVQAIADQWHQDMIANFKELNAAAVQRHDTMVSSLTGGFQFTFIDESDPARGNGSPITVYAEPKPIR